MSTTADQAVSPPPALNTYSGFLTTLLGDRESFFDEVVAGVDLGRKLRFALVTVMVLGGLYGGVAGAYSGPLQAVAAAVKLPFLFIATFVVCFPAFYIVQVLVGSRLRLLQVVVLVTSALALTAVVLAAFLPVPAFFLITGANYYFQHLLHLIVVGAAGIFGMYALHEGSRPFVSDAASTHARRSRSCGSGWCSSGSSGSRWPGTFARSWGTGINPSV
jgi:hypothetical protein